MVWEQGPGGPVPLHFQGKLKFWILHVSFIFFNWKAPDFEVLQPLACILS